MWSEAAIELEVIADEEYRTTPNTLFGHVICSRWMQLGFFLHVEELGGRPIDIIRAGEVQAAELAAKHFGRYGAA